MPIHLLDESLLSTHYVPGSVLGPGDTPVNKRDKKSCLLDVIFKWGQTVHKINVPGKKAISAKGPSAWRTVSQWEEEESSSVTGAVKDQVATVRMLASTQSATGSHWRF